MSDDTEADKLLRRIHASAIDNDTLGRPRSLVDGPTVHKIGEYLTRKDEDHDIGVIRKMFQPRNEHPVLHEMLDRIAARLKRVTDSDFLEVEEHNTLVRKGRELEREDVLREVSRLRAIYDETKNQQGQIILAILKRCFINKEHVGK